MTHIRQYQRYYIHDDTPPRHTCNRLVFAMCELLVAFIVGGIVLL
jgi:hypothetical protein